MFFKNELKKRIKNEKGLTLIELLAVIVILAIVAAIAIPAIGNIINNSRDKAILSDVQAGLSSAKIALADGSCGTDKICDKADIEFSSGDVEITKITFDNNSKATLIEAKVLANSGKFHGERIEKAIKANSGTFESAVLKISEDNLNKVLDK